VSKGFLQGKTVFSDAKGLRHTFSQPGQQNLNRHFAMIGQQDNTNESPRGMVNWDSDNFPKVVDFATKPITQLFSDLLQLKSIATKP
jgi:hypothetical protein